MRKHSSGKPVILRCKPFNFPQNIIKIRDGNFDQNQGSGSVRFGGAMSSSSVRFD